MVWVCVSWFYVACTIGLCYLHYGAQLRALKVRFYMPLVEIECAMGLGCVHHMVRVIIPWVR